MFFGLYILLMCIVVGVGSPVVWLELPHPRNRTFETINILLIRVGTCSKIQNVHLFDPHTIYIIAILT